MGRPLRTAARALLLAGLVVAGASAGQEATPPVQGLPEPPPEASLQGLPEPPPEPNLQDLPEPPPEASLQGLPEPPPEITITHVSLGSHVDSHLRTPVPKTIFKPIESIYVSVDTHTTGSDPIDGTLGVLWTFGSGEELRAVSDNSEEKLFHGDQTTEFHVSKPDRWPDGQYQAEVFLNGTSVYKATFVVR